MNSLADSVKPSLATLATSAAATANAAVWMDLIKGWAALATTVIAVPTAICMLLYWFLKARHEWRSDKVPNVPFKVDE